MKTFHSSTVTRLLLDWYANYFFTLDYLLDIVRKYIHKQGVCHRELKPENFLLNVTGHLKIPYFGLCSVF